MRWWVLWFAACLLTAARGQFLVTHRLNAPEDSEGSESANNTDHNQTFHRDGSILIPITKNVTSSRDLNSDTSTDSTTTVPGVSVDTNLEEIPIECSRSRMGESQQLPASTEQDSNEINGNAVIINAEMNQVNSTSVDDPTQHSQSIEAQGQEYISTEKPESGEYLSVERPESDEATDVTDGGASVGPRSSESQQEGDSASKEELTDFCDDCELVQTTHGPVKGHKWPGSAEIISFVDIPYGKADAPFKAPYTAQSWIDVHDITEHNKRCPQHHPTDGFVGDVDCLTLSIFKPAVAVNSSVLFYVHDYNFGSGDPSIYGPEHLVPKGVILVLPNYRFGALGFLCLNNETARGNAGLKDLSQALEWIRNNIEVFGGNPSNIVVGGDGHAGALVGYLALYSRSRYYISKAIIESGSVLSHLAIDRNPENTAKMLADNILKDNQSDVTVYNNTFDEATVEIIVEAAKDLKFNPCIEQGKEPFMDVTPWTLLHSEEIDITFMIGTAIYAGAHDAVETTESLIDKLNTDLGLILPNDLVFQNHEQKNEHALRVKTQYFGEGAIASSQVEELSRLFTDASYLSPTVRSARHLLEAGATVYLYEFAFVSDLNRELVSLNTSLQGAVRSDIIGYLFTQGGHLPEDNSLENTMIIRMVKLWVSFMNTGLPTAENVEWNELKKAEETEEEFLLIMNATLIPARGLHVDRLRLWTDLYDDYFIERSGTLALTPGFHPFIIIMLLLSYTKLHDDY